MHISTSSTAPSQADVLISLVAFSKTHPQITHLPKSVQNLVRRLATKKEFEDKEGSTIDRPLEESRLPKHLILISLGAEDKVNEGRLRALFAQTIKAARAKSKKSLAIIIQKEYEVHARLLGEAVAMSNHFLGRYKTGKALETEKKKLIHEVTFVLSDKASEKSFEQEAKLGAAIGEAVNVTRDLINDPPNVLTPRTMTEHAKKVAKENGLKITVFEKRDLEKMKMGAILAVNRASHHPEDDARLVVLEYMPNKNEKPIALVGKGIIFDTGGYDIKPSRHMADMQQDMSGAAAVFSVMSLLKKMGIKRNVVGIAPLTANLVSSTAYKSSEIITTYSGKTVEITNTDAEGRMVLCDAISYAIKTYSPKKLIDIATLTGACCVALGDRYAGMMGTDDEAMKELKEIGRKTDDLVWRLPIHPDWEEKMKSKIADLRNAEDGYYAGAQKGAAFLKFFVEKTPWTHLDIAGVAFTTDPKKYESHMGTGFGVRLMAYYLESLKP